MPYCCIKRIRVYCMNYEYVLKINDSNVFIRTSYIWKWLRLHPVQILFLPFRHIRKLLLCSIIRTKFKFTILTHYLANLENVATGYMFIIEERIWEKPCNEVSFRQRCKRKLKLHSIRGSGVQHVHACYLANCFNLLVEFLFLIIEYGLEKWFRNVLYKLLTICTRLLMPFRLG